MPPNPTRIRQVLAAASRGREVTLTYGGEDATGVRGGLTDRDEWQIQGYKQDYQFSVLLAADAFSPQPRKGETVAIGGETRRILGAWPDSIEALVRLDLGGRYG